MRLLFLLVFESRWKPVYSTAWNRKIKITKGKETENKKAATLRRNSK